MKLGLLTAAFPDLSLEEVAAWSAANGFEMLEVACWPAGGGERRRYAGVTHIDVDTLDVGAVRDVLDRHGLEISALAYYPNNLHPDDAHRAEVNGHLRKVVDAAARLEVPIVGTFAGNDKDRPLPENLERFRATWPELVAHAAGQGVRIAIENCPMIFSNDEWPEYETGNVTLITSTPEQKGDEREAFAGGYEPEFAVALRVPDVAASMYRLRSVGVECAFPEVYDTGVCHMAFFSDPDGNALILHHRYAPYADGNMP